MAAAGAAIPNLDLGVQFRVATLLFLPTQADLFARALEALGTISADTDDLYLVDVGLFDLWKQALGKVRDGYDVRAISSAVALMAQVVIQHVDGDVPEGELTPLLEIFKAAAIPADAGEVVRAAVEKLVKSGQVSEKAPWQALEYLCADYLAGP